MKNNTFTRWLYPIAGLLLLSLFLTCQSNNPAATTTNVIPEAKMARILADLNIAEAATSRLNGYPKDSLMQVYFKQVLDMHSVTVEAYEMQLRAIASDPVQMENLLKNSETLLEDTLPIKPTD